MTNINKDVWRYLDNNLAVKKNLFEGVINVRALAKRIISDLHTNWSLHSVISAIRRYEGKAEQRDYMKELYKQLKAAKLSTKTKLCSVLFYKKSAVRKRLSELFATIDFEGGDILRIFEVSKYIKIIIDEKTIINVNKIFDKDQIVNIEKNIGELNIIYSEEITKIPGLFAAIANELAANNISIVDSMICHSEHIIIVQEKDIQHAFDVLFALLHK